MKAKQFGVVIILLLIINACNSNKTDNHKEAKENITTPRQFRNVDWNMTREEVIKSEEALLDKSANDTNELFYPSVDLFNRKFSLGYVFDQSKLKAALYRTKISTGDNAFQIYETIKKSLSKKYGHPIKDTILWKDSDAFSKSKIELINEGLNVGLAEIKANWGDNTTTPNRLIMLECKRQGLYVFINISNVDGDWYFEKLERKEKENSQKL